VFHRRVAGAGGQSVLQLDVPELTDGTSLPQNSPLVESARKLISDHGGPWVRVSHPRASAYSKRATQSS
jgi:hypothetical protein